MPLRAPATQWNNQSPINGLSGCAGILNVNCCKVLITSIDPHDNCNRYKQRYIIQGLWGLPYSGSWTGRRDGRVKSFKWMGLNGFDLLIS